MMTQHRLNSSFKWTEGKEWILNGNVCSFPNRKKLHNGSILDLIQLLFPKWLSNTQAIFKHLQTPNFHSKPMLYCFIHFSTSTWVSALSFQHKASWTFLDPFEENSTSCTYEFCLDAGPHWFYKKHLILHSTVDFLVYNKLLCSDHLLHLCQIWNVWQSYRVRFDLDLPWTAPPKLTKMSSLTLRDGFRHDLSLQGAQISTIWHWGLNGGCLREGEMRCKLKGVMAHSVILPKATRYAGPVGPDFVTGLLGTHVPAFSMSCTSLLLPFPSIYTFTRNMHTHMVMEKESYCIIQKQIP